MQTAFRVAYSLVVAILVVLFVILGTRTFYAEPEGPEEPYGRYGYAPYEPKIACESGGRCYDPSTGRTLTGDELRQRQEEQADSDEAIRTYEAKRRTFIEEERAPYRRNVFVLAMALGVATVAGGLYLFRRVEALPLGLMLGGLGVIFYAWVQAAEDFAEIGMAPMFAVVAVGLAAVLLVGYRFLGFGPPPGRE